MEIQDTPEGLIAISEAQHMDDIVMIAASFID